MMGAADALCGCNETSLRSGVRVIAVCGVDRMPEAFGKLSLTDNRGC